MGIKKVKLIFFLFFLVVVPFTKNYSEDFVFKNNKYRFSFDVRSIFSSHQICSSFDDFVDGTVLYIESEEEEEFIISLLRQKELNEIWINLVYYYGKFLWFNGNDALYVTHNLTIVPFRRHFKMSLKEDGSVSWNQVSFVSNHLFICKSKIWTNLESNCSVNGININNLSCLCKPFYKGENCETYNPPSNYSSTKIIIKQRNVYSLEEDIIIIAENTNGYLLELFWLSTNKDFIFSKTKVQTLKASLPGDYWIAAFGIDQDGRYTDPVEITISVRDDVEFKDIRVIGDSTKYTIRNNPEFRIDTLTIGNYNTIKWEQKFPLNFKSNFEVVNNGKSIIFPNGLHENYFGEYIFYIEMETISGNKINESVRVIINERPLTLSVNESDRVVEMNSPIYVYSSFRDPENRSYENSLFISIQNEEECVKYEVIKNESDYISFYYIPTKELKYTVEIIFSKGNRSTSKNFVHEALDKYVPIFRGRFFDEKIIGWMDTQQYFEKKEDYEITWNLENQDLDLLSCGVRDIPIIVYENNNVGDVVVTMKLAPKTKRREEGVYEIVNILRSTSYEEENEIQFLIDKTIADEFDYATLEFYLEDEAYVLAGIFYCDFQEEKWINLVEPTQERSISFLIPPSTSNNETTYFKVEFYEGEDYDNNLVLLSKGEFEICSRDIGVFMRRTKLQQYFGNILSYEENDVKELSKEELFNTLDGCLILSLFELSLDMSSISNLSNTINFLLFELKDRKGNVTKNPEIGYFEIEKVWFLLLKVVIEHPKSYDFDLKYFEIINYYVNYEKKRKNLEMVLYTMSTLIKRVLSNVQYFSAKENLEIDDEVILFNGEDLGGAIISKSLSVLLRNLMKNVEYGEIYDYNEKCILDLKCDKFFGEELLESRRTLNETYSIWKSFFFEQMNHIPVDTIIDYFSFTVDKFNLGVFFNIYEYMGDDFVLNDWEQMGDFEISFDRITNNDPEKYVYQCQYLPSESSDYNFIDCDSTFLFSSKILCECNRINAIYRVLVYPLDSSNAEIIFSFMVKYFQIFLICFLFVSCVLFMIFFSVLALLMTKKWKKKKKSISILPSGISVTTVHNNLNKINFGSVDIEPNCIEHYVGHSSNDMSRYVVKIDDSDNSEASKESINSMSGANSFNSSHHSLNSLSDNNHYCNNDNDNNFNEYKQFSKSSLKCDDEYNDRKVLKNNNGAFLTLSDSIFRFTRKSWKDEIASPTRFLRQYTSDDCANFKEQNFIKKGE